MRLEGLVTYADETGIDGASQYCLLGGYTGSPRQWKELTKEWQSILSGKANEFHATDFFNSKGEFRGWAMSDRKDLLRRLLGAINRRRLTAAYGAVDIAAFDALPLEDRQMLTGGIVKIGPQNHWQTAFLSSGAPSRAFFSALLHLIGGVIRENPGDAQLHFIFDEQHTRETRIKETFDEVWRNKFANTKRSSVGFLPQNQRDRLGTIDFGKSDKILPLQAADLFCYVWHRILEGAINSELLQIANGEIQKKSPKIAVLKERDLQKLLADYRRSIQEAIGQVPRGKAATFSE